MRSPMLMLCLLMTIGLSAIAQSPNKSKKEQTKFPSGDTYKNNKLTCIIIPADVGTWCYDIYADGRLIIHQPSIPGLPGNAGFTTKDAATKVGNLVIKKIKNGDMPPTITAEEMRKLKAIP